MLETVSLRCTSKRCSLMAFSFLFWSLELRTASDDERHELGGLNPRLRGFFGDGPATRIPAAMVLPGSEANWESWLLGFLPRDAPRDLFPGL